MLGADDTPYKLLSPRKSRHLLLLEEIRIPRPQIASPRTRTEALKLGRRLFTSFKIKFTDGSRVSYGGRVYLIQGHDSGITVFHGQDNVFARY